jgi:hypothetical protein
MTPRQRLARLLEVALTIGLGILAVRFGIPPGTIPPLLPPINVPPVVVPPSPGLNLPPVTINVPSAPPVPAPVRPEPAPEVIKLDPIAATVKLLSPRSYCTATIIGPRDANGQQLVLTAEHCSPRVGSKHTLVLRDGRRITAQTIATYSAPDYAWMRTEKSAEEYPYTLLHPGPVTSGMTVYHSGYGVSQPGDGVRGTADKSQGGNGRWHFKLSVSHGDSGSGIIDAATGRLVGVVSTGDGRDPSSWTNGPTVEVIAIPPVNAPGASSPGVCPDGRCPIGVISLP